MTRKSSKLMGVWILLGLAVRLAANPLPIRYDLREVDGGLITSIKRQTGGTCWAHAVMASIESNLLRTGTWNIESMGVEPNLNEYHLDWWNGFNRIHNDDATPTWGSGLIIHEGGDYLMTAAYIARGDGVVYNGESNDTSERDDSWYYQQPDRRNSGNLVFYVHDIVWLTMGSDRQGIDLIKQCLMDHGAIGTCIGYSEFHYNGELKAFYQPQSFPGAPNHAVTIIGWDDEKETQSPEKGAWLCKNSWGSQWGEQGYFWVSYDDKHCARHPEMGAVSFQGADVTSFDKIYSWDTHGWRDTMQGCTTAFNRFVTQNHDRITGVSYYTSVDSVQVTVQLYDDFNQDLENLLCTENGFQVNRGYHTTLLNTPIEFSRGDDFYVAVTLSDGGHAFDRTSQVSVLLGSSSAATTVPSSARPNESYYWSESQWKDLYDYVPSGWPSGTANFCIKALAVDVTTTPDETNNPVRAVLYPNYPNPFNSKTALIFTVLETGKVKIRLYDVQGRLVRTLFDEECGTETFRIEWDGRDDAGRSVSSGVYICRLQTRFGSSSRKLTLLR